MILNGDIIIFDFEKNTNINRWYSTNDDVMGGVSNSLMNLDENGNGVFTGVVSTENNGGFAMVRLPLNINLSDDLKNIVLHVKGDGKKYELRMKSNRSQQYWYIYSFQTTAKLEIIEIPLKDFYPSYRGTKLNLDNFSSNTIKEIAFLIGNKKNEEFKLTINKISIN
jgi:NADH dehydrogenase [ubiquinone] 1 alpha subcomplex assembly factor 1